MKHCGVECKKIHKYCTGKFNSTKINASYEVKTIYHVRIVKQGEM